MNQPLHTKIHHALASAEQFSLLLDKETQAIQSARYDVFETLQDSKIYMAQQYQEAVLAFEDHVEELKTIDQSLKDALHTAYARFSAASELNRKALEAAKKVSERIVKLIMDAAKRTVMDGPSYGAGGKQTLSEKIPIHFKLNEVL